MITLDIDYKAMAKRMSKIRKEKGMTQAQLAEKAGLTNNYISNIETQHSIPSLETLVKICAALEVTPNDLLIGSVQTSNEYLLDDSFEKFLQCTPKEKRLINKFIVAFLDERKQK